MASETWSDETVRIDEARGLRLSTRRAIDPELGREIVDEVLTDLRSGEVLASGRSLSVPRPDGDLLDRYLADRERAAQQERFWRDEYARMTFEQRVTAWYDDLRRLIRSNEELGFDDSAIFTPESYARWLAREPDMERVLRAVAERLGRSPDLLARRVGLAPRRRGRSRGQRKE